MKVKDTCIKCGLEIWFEKRDIQPVPKKIIEGFKRDNKTIKDKLNETETKGIFIKREEYVIRHNIFRKALKDMIKLPVGIIKCPACDSEQLILRRADENI